MADQEATSPLHDAVHGQREVDAVASRFHPGPELQLDGRPTAEDDAQEQEPVSAGARSDDPALRRVPPAPNSSTSAGQTRSRIQHWGGSQFVPTHTAAASPDGPRLTTSIVSSSGGARSLSPTLRRSSSMRSVGSAHGSIRSKLHTRGSMRDADAAAHLVRSLPCKHVPMADCSPVFAPSRVSCTLAVAGRCPADSVSQLSSPLASRASTAGRPRGSRGRLRSPSRGDGSGSRASTAATQRTQRRGSGDDTERIMEAFKQRAAILEAMNTDPPRSPLRGLRRGTPGHSGGSSRASTAHASVFPSRSTRAAPPVHVRNAAAGLRCRLRVDHVAAVVTCDLGCLL